MKNLILFVVFFTTVFFTSCSKDDLDVDLNTTLSEDINVVANTATRLSNSKENLTGYPFSSSVILNLSNADTQNYLNKLKSVKIKKLTYKVVDFGTSHGTLSGILSADDIEIHSVENLLLKTETNEGTVFEVQNVATGLSKMETNLLNNKKVTIKISGMKSCSCNMTFKVNVTAELAIVANALN